MKNLIPYIIVLAILGGGGGVLYTQQSKSLDLAQYEQKLAEQRTAFAEQALFTRTMADDKVQFERARLMDWHTREVKKIGKAHPESSKPERFLANLKTKAEKDKKAKAKLEAYQERFDWIKGVWDKTLQDGDYEALLSQAQHGVRYDILDIGPAEGPDGKKSLKLDLLLWGPVKDQIRFGGFTIQFIREVESTDKRGKTKKKVALVKVEASGPPELLHPSGPNPAPMEWIDAWPPGVMVGYYRGLPLFPHDATKFSLKLEVELNTYTQAATPVVFEWKNIDVKPEWRAPEGDAFDALVSEASEEELKAAGIKVD